MNSLETIVWGDRRLTLFRDGSPPIYTTPEGRFAVQWGDTWKTFGTIKSAEKFGKTGRPTVKLFTPATSGTICHSSSIIVVDAAEWTEGGRIIDGDGKRHLARYYEWYGYDAEAIAQLKDWEKRRLAAEKQFNAELQKIVKRLKQVTRRNLPDLLKGDQPNGGAK